MGLGVCVLRQPFFCHSFKLMLVSENEEAWMREDRLDQRVSSSQSLRPFVGAIEVDVEIPSESRGRIAHRAGKVSHGKVIRNHQQIDIAERMHSRSRHRAKDQRDANPRVKRVENVAQHVNDARGFQDQPLQLHKDRTTGIGLKVHLPSGLLSDDKSDGNEHRQFPLHGATAGAGKPYDLSKVKPLVRSQQQDR